MSVEISKLDKVVSGSGGVPTRPDGACASAYTGKYVEIEVLKGDTLSAIAVKAGVPVSTLQQLNGLKDDTIRSDRSLRFRWRSNNLVVEDGLVKRYGKV